MLRRAAIALGLCGLATPSLATEWVNCADPTGAASFDFLVGTLDVLAISGLTITVGEQVWASDVSYGPGDPVSVGQAFEDTHTILIDAVNQDLTAKVAELRLFKASEADGMIAYGGTLRIPGHGAWAVSCSGG
jgi:hypothetical protein